ncbi:MAG: penicillin-binding transpeptidase domain-containing protein [Defluviitaleaceae bacterium]|nr:penicillin-binding transpeptidase domain-containing protein [Defluviitaleaceae bacterium]MCL2835648.1 penicillin-binding transpeptidase domain-containing protein [Defluviitaleaceae bacterium]
MHTANMKIKRKLLFILAVFEAMMIFLLFRVFYIQAFEAEHLQQRAYEQQTRDRLIAPNRGTIYDRNMVGLAVTESVCSVSVIRAQIQDPEHVARVLAELLDMEYEEVLAKVKKRVALERIKTKVDKETADKIRALDLPGVVVDEDIKRIYPFGNLASQVIGFVGRDNQGIIGLEAKYDRFMKGEAGKILTQTDAAGRQITGGDISRQEPVDGLNLVTTLDYVVQRYAEQTIQKAVDLRGAKRGLIIVMNPQNGEIYAMANYPGFDLNEPFEINDPQLAAIWQTFTMDEQLSHLNRMWRNFGLNDTYEPGSTFKVMTAAAGLDEGVISPSGHFNCGSGTQVANRFIKCWRSPRSHGSQNFVQGMQNSCNPVFMETAARLGKETFYEYMNAFGFTSKTGVDLPGEAVGILHKLDNVGPVELATMSFGQSFQISPLQLMRAVSACVNGGYMVTPHVGLRLTDSNGMIADEFVYERGEQVISEDTSRLMRDILESVVETGTGNRSYLPGYRVGGKTATSEKLPRRSGKYISSFITLAPAENPAVLALVLIDEPVGAYYGGQVAGPVMKELLENILPYLGVEPVYSDSELEMKGVGTVSVPLLTGLDFKTASDMLKTLGVNIDSSGEGSLITSQFPPPGEEINRGSKVIVYFE